MSNVAAVVILYNPDIEVYDNITTYNYQIEKLFVVDNSENANYKLTEKIKLLDNTEYIGNNTNLGIAAAINIGAVKAINEGYKFLFTMDQDSKASPGMVARLMEVMNSSDKIGIVAAEHIDTEIQQQPSSEKHTEVLYTMASGNLIDLYAYQIAGGYLEKLFIDHVDHEYCLRIRKNGFKIIKVPDAILYHRVGNVSKRRFLNHYLFPTNHSPIRIYYRTRNRFYIDEIYRDVFPEYFKEDRRNMRREILEILLYDDKRIRKIKMMLKGFLDYKRNRFGKYENVS